MVDWEHLFNEIAKEVYQSVKPILHSQKAKEIVGRGAGGDLTRYIDALAEDVVIKILEENNVSCILVSEECGTKTIGKEPKAYVILDSIDGTVNALRGIPFFCTSIAFSTGPHLSDITMGFVINLSNKEKFSAIKGKGAYKGKTRLKPSTITNVNESLISVELSLPGNQEQLIHLMPLLLNSKKIRHLGATALEICYVASGYLDAFVDIRNMARAVDLAAAYIILKETGGIMITPDGKELNMRLGANERTHIIATANLTICKEILRLLK